MPAPKGRLEVDAPADTLVYMVAGYVVIIGTILGYVASLILKGTRLDREEKARGSDHPHPAK